MRNFALKIWTTLLLAALLLSSAPAFAVASSAPPTILSYQGRLTDSGGNLLGGTGTTYYFQFSLWTSPTVGSGTQVWPAATPATTTATVTQGVFNVNIGDTANGYPDALNINFANYPQLYLQVQVSANNLSSETLTPRQQMTSAVYAQVAGATVGLNQSAFGTTTPIFNSAATIAATSSAVAGLTIVGAPSQSANLLQVQNNLLQNLFSVSSSGGLTAASIFSTGSTTIGAGFTSLTSNLFASTTLLGNTLLVNATTTSFFATVASTTNLTVSSVQSSLLKTTASGQVVAAIAGTDYATPASVATAFPFTPAAGWLTPTNATSTLIGFTKGLYALASSTIGNGNQNGGLTISGGATTTGNASILGSLVIGTSTGALSTVGGAQLYLYNNNTSGASPALVIGGNSGGDTDFWIGRSNQNDSVSNDSLQFGQTLTPGASPILTLNYQSNVGIGTTSPFAKLSVNANPTDAAINAVLFAIGSSTQTGTSTLFSVGNNGAFDVGTSSNSGFHLISNAATAGNGLAVTTSNTGSGVTLGVVSNSANEALTLQSVGTGGFNLIGGSGTGVSNNLQIKTGTNQRLVFEGNGTVGSGAVVGFNNTNFDFSNTLGRTAVGTTPYLQFAGGGDSGITASTEVADALFNFAQTKTHTNGAIALQRSFLIKAPTEAFATYANGTNVITDLATLGISGAPITSATGNGTTTNAHTLLLSASTLNASTTNSYGLTVNANTGAVNNYAAEFLGGNVGLGTTSPFATLSVNGSGFFGGTVTATNITATGTLQALNILATGSTTLQNFTANFATTSQATTTNFAITGIASSLLKTLSNGAVVAATPGTDYLTASSIFAYPFIGNATTTQLAFNGGATFVGATTTALAVTGSSTINTLNLSNALTVANGGTGSTTLGGILAGNGTSAVKSVAIGSGLTFDGTTLATNGAGITALGPLGQTQTGSTQLLATSTNGTDFTITASGNTQTFNLPFSSLTSNGKLASSDFITFENKISSSSLSAVYPLAYAPSTGVFTTAFSTTTANTFSALNTFNGGITAYASSTIGNGSQAGGLSVNGGASITGNLGIGTSTPFEQLTVIPSASTVRFTNSTTTGLSAPISVYVQGAYAYVADNGNSSLVIFNLANPSMPAKVSSISTGLSSPSSVYVQGRYAYVVDSGNNSLSVFDISSPASPFFVGQTFSGLTIPTSVYVQGHYAYVADNFSGLVVFDTSNPASPIKVDQINTGLTTAQSVYVQGRYAYVADNAGALVSFDISNPLSLIESGSVSTGLVNPTSVYVQGRYAYVTDSGSHLLATFDISKPASMTRVSAVSSGLNSPQSVYVQGRYAYITDSSSGLVTFDISNPASSTEISNVTTGTSNPSSIFVQGRYAYLANPQGGLSTYDLGGSYIQQGEFGGLEAGTLSVQNNFSAFDGEFAGGLTVGNNANVNGSLAITGSTFNAPLGSAQNYSLFSVNTASSTNPILTAMYNGNVGVGTTSPFATLSVNGSGFFGGNLTATNITATGTLQALNILATGSTTLQNFTANFATTSQATTTNFAITGITSSLLKTLSNGAVVAATPGTDYLTAASIFAFPFTSTSAFGTAANATSTLIGFTDGLYSTASSTFTSGLNVSGTLAFSGTSNIVTVNGTSAAKVDTSTNDVAFGLFTTSAGGAGPNQAIGDLNSATGGYSSAYGYQNTASGYLSGAFGNQNTASNNTSYAIGMSNNVSGVQSTAIGYALVNAVNNSVMVGPGNTSKLTILNTQQAGFGTTSPFADFAVQANNGDTNTTLFAIGSSTQSATTTLFSISNTGSTTLFQLNSSLLKTNANGTIVAAIPGTDYLTAGAIFGYPFIGNATTTQLAFNGGATFVGATSTAFAVTGSSTITGQFNALGGATFGNATINALTANGGTFSGTFAGAHTYSGAITFSSTIGVTSLATLTGGILTNASSTLGNFTANFATTSQATTTNFAITGITSSLLKTLSNGAVVAATPGTDYLTAASIFAFPFTQTTFGAINANATSTLIGFTKGLYALASSTIGDGTQGGGLTISGGATTTGNFTFTGASPFVLIPNGVNQALNFGTSTAGTPTLSLSTRSSLSGLVGIGTSTPWGKLSVEMGQVTPAFVVSNQGSSSPSFIIGGVNQNGFVGVGTSSPFAFFSVQGSSGQIVDFATAAGNSAYHLTQAGLSGFGTTSPFAKVSIQTNYGDNTPTLFAIGSTTSLGTTNLFTVSNTGNVGVGTANPGSLLDVLATTTNTSTNLTISNIASSTSAAVAEAFSLALSGSPSERTAASIAAVKTGNWYSGNAASVASDLTFSTRNNDALSEVARFTAAGNLGLGTTSPAALFEIASSVTTATTSILGRGSDANFELFTRQDKSSNAAGALVGELGLEYNGGENASVRFLRGNASTGGFITFATNNGTERMRIDSNGNVGIGTTTPGSFFAVQGNALFSGNLGVANITATGTLQALNILATGSTTLQNFTANFATTSQATTTNFAITGVTGQLLKTLSSGAVVAALAGTDYATPASVATAFPFTPAAGWLTPTNATSTLIGFTNGLYALASSTIGNGNQNGGLTISGGATTTGSASILGSLVIGTSTGALSTVGGAQLYLYNNNTSGASPALVIGGNPGGDTDFWIGRSNQNDSVSNDSLQFGQTLTPGASPILTLNYQSNVGIGTTSPFAKFAIHANPTDAAINTTLFAIGSSTATATTTFFTVSNTGQLTIGQNSAPVSSATQLTVLAGTTTITRVSGSALQGGNSGSSVYVQGRYAYTVQGNSPTNAFSVWDVSNPASPVLMSASTLNNAAGTKGPAISVQGQYAYIAEDAGTTGAFEVWNVSRPNSPVRVGQANLSNGGAVGSGDGLYVSGRYAYVVEGSGTSNGFEIFDISNPSAPVRVGSGTLTGSNGVDTIFVQGNFAYVVAGNTTANAFEIWNVQNPAAPVLVSTGTINGGSGANGGAGIYVQGRYAYLANSAISTNAFEIWDVASSTNPFRIGQGTLNQGGGTGAAVNGISVQGRYAYIAESEGTNGAFEVWDVSTPNTPVRVAQSNLSNGAGYGDSLSVQGRYAYITEGSASTNAFEIFDLGGAYIQQLETGGIETGTLSVRNNLAAVDGLFAGGLSVGQSLDVTGSGSFVSATSTFNTTANIFNIATASSTSSIFSVLGNGNVGIGTTTPWRTLSVGANNIGSFAVSTTTSGCATFSANGELYSTGSACGSGGSAFPFAPGTNFGVAENATSTPIFFTAGLQASSTSQFSNSSTTLATIANAYITKLGNLATAGFVKTASDGTLSVDTSTYLIANQTITLSGAVTGSGATTITTSFGSQAAGTFLANNTSAAAAPTFIATSSIFGTGTGGQVLAWNNGVPQWIASTTYAAGAGISTSFANGQLTITNTGATFGYPFPASATSSPLMLLASTTIGNGAQNAGLTISGGATTTGSAYIAGNLGIGTAAPAYKLDVSGQINSSNKITANESSGSANGGFSFTQDGAQDTGMFSPSDGELDFYNNGVLKVSVSPSGNVGIVSTLAIGGASIGTNAFAVSGTANFGGTVTASNIINSGVSANQIIYTNNAKQEVSVASSSIFGIGTGGQVLAWNNGTPQWIASTTYVGGAGISTSFANGQLTITNTGAAFAYPFPSSATSSALSFNGGITVNGPATTATSLTLGGAGQLTSGTLLSLGVTTAGGGLSAFTGSLISGSNQRNAGINLTDTGQWINLNRQYTPTAGITTVNGDLVDLVSSCNGASAACTDNSHILSITQSATSSSAAALFVSTSGTGPAATFTGGNVGIGTTNPFAKLNVIGTTKGTSFDVGPSATGNFVDIYGNASSGGTVHIGTNYLTTDGSLALGTYTTPDTMTLTTSGSVGIGTSSPQALVHISGTGASVGLIVRSSSGGAAIGIGSAGIQAYTNDSIFGSGLAPLVLQPAGGDIGIGTTSPVVDTNGYRYLTVSGEAGGANVSGAISAGGNITGTANPVGEFSFYNAAIGSSNKRTAAIFSFTQGAINSGDLEFYTENAGSAVEAMAMNHLGNIGIGSSSPNNLLTITDTSTTLAGVRIDDTATAVSGNAGPLVLNAKDGNNHLMFEVDGVQKAIEYVQSSNLHFYVGGDKMVLNSGGGIFFNAGVTGSNTGDFLCFNTSTSEVTKGTTCTLSSGKVKNNIATSTSGLADILKLSPVTFKYDQGFGDNGSTTQVGFIADQVATINPLFAEYATAPIQTPNGPINIGDPSGINWNAITDSLVGAVQTLNQRTQGLADSTSTMQINAGQVSFLNPATTTVAVGTNVWTIATSSATGTTPIIAISAPASSTPSVSISGTLYLNGKDIGSAVASSSATTTTGQITSGPLGGASGDFISALNSAFAAIAGLTQTGVRELGLAVHASVGVFDKLFAKEVHTDLLCVGSTCVTQAQFVAMVNASTSGGSSSGGSSGGSGGGSSTSTPPTITISGSNPATISVGDTYSDLGATAMDNQGTSLGVNTFVNGIAESPVIIDSSSVATDTIDYVATDTWGNTATSTRTVIIQ